MSSYVRPAHNCNNLSDDPLSDDPELRKELATMFLSYCPQLLSEIQAAMTARDAPQLQFVAHTLKGSAGIFKAQTAFDAAFRLERVGEESDWDHAEKAWQTVQNEMASLASSLADEIAAVP